MRLPRFGADFDERAFAGMDSASLKGSEPPRQSACRRHRPLSPRCKIRAFRRADAFPFAGVITVFRSEKRERGKIPKTQQAAVLPRFFRQYRVDSHAAGSFFRTRLPFFACGNEVGLVFNQLFVKRKQGDAFARAHFVRLCRAIDSALERAAKIVGVVLNHVQNLINRITGNGFFDVETVFFVVFKENVGFVHAPEEIVQVTHDVLIRADEENAEVVRRSRNDFVKVKRVADVFEIDEFRDFPVAVASDIDERCRHGRFFREAVNRRNREKLVNRPAVEQGLENGEIADVLLGKHDVQIEQIFGNVAFERGNFLMDLAADVPKKAVGFGAVFEVEIAVLEKRMRFFPLLACIVETFEQAVMAAVVENFFEFPNNRRFLRVTSG